MLAAAPFLRRRTVRFVGNQEVIPKTAYRKCGLLVTRNSRLLETCSTRKSVNISAPHGEPGDSAHFGRTKVDGSLTCSPGNKLNCELSGPGRRADLYSDFGDQRISKCLCFSKFEVGFSATGRGLIIAKYAAKFDKIGVFIVTYLIIKTSWRRGGDSLMPDSAISQQIHEIWCNPL